MEPKPIEWIGDSLERLRDCAPDVRRQIGRELRMVQRGKMPADFRAMPNVGSGVLEIRVHTGGEYRVFYVAKFEEAVYVLHCFRKKTAKTSPMDLDLGKRRYRTMLERRKNEVY